MDRGVSVMELQCHVQCSSHLVEDVHHGLRGKVLHMLSVLAEALEELHTPEHHLRLLQTTTHTHTHNLYTECHSAAVVYTDRSLTAPWLQTRGVLTICWLHASDYGAYLYHHYV